MRIRQPRKPPWNTLRDISERIANRLSWVDVIQGFLLTREDIYSEALYYAHEAWAKFDSHKARCSMPVWVYTQVYYKMLDSIRAAGTTIRVPRSAKLSGLADKNQPKIVRIIQRADVSGVNYGRPKIAGAVSDVEDPFDWELEACIPLLRNDLQEFLQKIRFPSVAGDPNMLLDILILRLGLPPAAHPASEREIGDIFNVSESRVSQLLSRAKPILLRELRNRMGVTATIDKINVSAPRRKWKASKRKHVSRRRSYRSR